MNDQRSVPQPLGTCNWLGYDFNVWPKNQPFTGFPGIYIFVQVRMNTAWAIYVGESNAVGSRMADHFADVQGPWNWATHIHCLSVSNQHARLELEKRLIGQCNPPRNILHRTGPANSAFSGIDLYGLIGVI